MISRLSYGHLDPAGRPTCVHSRTTVRLDRQPNVGSGDKVATNLQVQLNVQGGAPRGAGTTIGQVLVPLHVFLVAHHHPQQNLKRQLERTVRGALNKSVSAGGAWFFVDVV